MWQVRERENGVVVFTAPLVLIKGEILQSYYELFVSLSVIRYVTMSIYQNNQPKYFTPPPSLSFFPIVQNNEGETRTLDI